METSLELNSKDCTNPYFISFYYKMAVSCITENSLLQPVLSQNTFKLARTCICITHVTHVSITRVYITYKPRYQTHSTVTHVFTQGAHAGLTKYYICFFICKALVLFFGYFHPEGLVKSYFCWKRKFQN